VLLLSCIADGVAADGGGAWWRRRRPVVPLHTAPVDTDMQPVVMAPAINSTPADDTKLHRSASNSVTLVLPSTTMSRSAGNSPGVTMKPAGASPLVPSCRSAFSLATGGVTSSGSVALSTSPYSDSAAADHGSQRQKITSVKQMAQLFEDAASSWQRDVRRQHQLGVDVLAQSRQFAAERRHFAVNSELFFFPTCSTTTTTTTSTSTAATITTTCPASSTQTSSKTSETRSSTSGHQLRPAAATQRHMDLRLPASGTTPPFV